MAVRFFSFLIIFKIIFFMYVASNFEFLQVIQFVFELKRIMHCVDSKTHNINFFLMMIYHIFLKITWYSSLYQTDVLTVVNNQFYKCAVRSEMEKIKGVQFGVIGALCLSVASSVSIVICNKALMSSLAFSLALTPLVSTRYMLFFIFCSWAIV